MRIGIHVCGVLYGVAVNERDIQSVSRPCVRITGLITAILSNNRSHTSRLCVIPTCVVRCLYLIGTYRYIVFVIDKSYQYKNGKL